ncbi:MAG TPA: GAF domain-containing SpoIIE family protein phosphatase [Chthoniobacteraceae bacterium]|jgi:sigma-B regulation protein RsbU (phosphoserine phosphatase)
MASDTATLERQLQVYKGLVEVSALINGITDQDALLPAILEVARRVLSVEAASLFLVTQSGDLELAAADGGLPPPVGKLIVPRGRGISGWVLEHGQSLLVADAYKDPRFFPDADKQTGFKTRSILCVPLTRNGTQIGVLQGINPIGHFSFDQEDLEAFTAYGNLAATAIDKLRTIRRQQAQERLAQEFAFAHEIQTSFLPQQLPQRNDLRFAATYRPALNVGGDFYDVVEGSPDEYYFVIGDVSGKGMPAALLMAQALSSLRLILHPGISPETALAQWNAMLIGHTIRGMFITALLGRIRLPQRQVDFANAGHCSPYRIGALGEPPAEVKMPGAPPLGILPQLPQNGHTITLHPDEWLVCFTDGLTESFNSDDVPLDREGVVRLLDRRFETAADVVDSLNAGEINHRRSADPHDDLTVLVMGPR